jgi:cation:H+ antiporter
MIPFNLQIYPLWISIAAFVVAGAAIAFASVRLSALADRLADLTGMGEALMGGIFLGASTSLSGITASVTAAAEGLPALSLSNAVGGIAAQMVMLVIADISYKNANLEHAAASLENMMQGTLQIIMLGMLLFAITGPELTFWGIHYITPLMFLTYLGGMVIVNSAIKSPMWRPRITRETREDQPREAQGSESHVMRLWISFAATALIVMVSGWLLTQAADSIASRTALSQSLVGGLFVAVTTSTAELITALAAVHRGALTLAVGDILGGNAFDTLFAAVADIFFREGSIYHRATGGIVSLLTLAIIMSGVLLLGLLRREKKGFARIGFESAFVIVIYLVGIALLAGNR